MIDFWETFLFAIKRKHKNSLLDEKSQQEIIEKLGLPCFVKPTAAGSSLGITKVKSIDQFDEAVKHAQAQGCDALVEAFLDNLDFLVGNLTDLFLPLF